MNKYIISYHNGKKNVSVIRYADSKEEAMQKLCRQHGWDEFITWLGDQDWSDGIFSHNGNGYEFRILEVA